MQVISHRGLWNEPAEKNTRVAFERSFGLGFGTETDIRDLDGELVISHDPPTRSQQPVTVVELFELYAAAGAHTAGLPLALNIKADGLAAELAVLVARYEIGTAYVFDMSVPDMRAYLDPVVPSPLTVYCRHSDAEPSPSFYDGSRGVWLDSFGDESWIDVDVIGAHLDAGKSVCVVSPDLHGRDPHPLWERVAMGALDERVSVCTDDPQGLRRMVEGV